MLYVGFLSGSTVTAVLKLDAVTAACIKERNVFAYLRKCFTFSEKLYNVSQLCYFMYFLIGKILRLCHFSISS